jgi:alpha-methylacyl-CoA racemase
MSSAANPSPYRNLKSPLQSIRVLELAGLAPAPFAGMVLSDFGADVIRIDRPGGSGPPDLLCRGKRSCAVDIKSAEGAQLLLKLIQKCDVVLDPYRPGVLERLGLGPAVMHAHNKQLGASTLSLSALTAFLFFFLPVIARITGYGQDGPMAAAAGHDINYVAMSGLLSTFGPANSMPSWPHNLVADFAGGGLMCAFGVLAALMHRQNTGFGQVIDVSMTHGVCIRWTRLSHFFSNQFLSQALLMLALSST